MTRDDNGCLVYVFSSLSEDFVDIFGEDFFYNEYSKMRQKRKIKSKNLEIDSNREEYAKMISSAKKTDREIKYLPDANLEPISINIFDDSVAFINYELEAFVIEIKNRELRNSYEKHFDMLWAIASE